MQQEFSLYRYLFLTLRPSMGKYLLFILLLGFLGLSCKSSYEKIRTSGDAQLMLKTANKLYAEKSYFKASTLYDLIFSNFRGQKEAEDIYYNNAYCNYYLSNYETANYMFTNYSNTFFNSTRKEEAEFMAAYASYKLSPNYKLDQSSTLKAIDQFQTFANNYPESKRIKECNQLIDELRLKLEIKAFEQGKLYYNIQYYQSSISTLTNLLTDFPETKNEKEIRSLMIKASYEWAINSIFEKQKERFLKTVELSDIYLNKFPSGKNQEIKDIRKKAINKSNNPLYNGYKDTSSKN
ncbi:MAG: outer membrane protein assembly factor BamD [Saprospiraceae bacterium]